MVCSFSVLVRPDGSVLKAYGDVTNGIGWERGSLARSSIFFVLPRKYHDRVRELLAGRPGRHCTEAIRLIHNSRGALTYYFKLRDAGRTAVWLDFVSERGMEPRPHCSFPDLTAPDRLSRDAYLDRVAGRIDAEGKTSLTMFEFAGLDGRPGAAEGEAGGEPADDGGPSLRASVESSLGAWSTDGSVGVLDGCSYAIVHESAVEAEVIVSDVSAAARERGFSDADLSARTETVRLDRNARTDGLRDGLSHLAGRFLRAAGTLLKRVPKALRLSEAIREARSGRDMVLAALEEGVDLAYRPVVGLDDGMRSFALASPVLRIGGTERAPAELVDLDADPALALRIDLAAVDRAGSDLEDEVAAKGRAGLAVLEIQAGSLLHPDFAGRVRARFAAGRAVPGSLGFRPLDANFAILRHDKVALLRDRLGAEHPIWLRHFPAAVSGEAPLPAAGNAYVEVSLPFLTSLLRLRDGPEAIARLLDLWRGVGIHLVTTGLDTPHSAVLARQLGIEFGVGAVFEG
jgi:EAL domain-containing protein (putative c-di-GMP-specific phosphodiesterase class I)